jgi:hypothetical protein
MCIRNEFESISECSPKCVASALVFKSTEICPQTMFFLRISAVYKYICHNHIYLLASQEGLCSMELVSYTHIPRFIFRAVRLELV